MNNKGIKYLGMSFLWGISGCLCAAGNPPTTSFLDRKIDRESVIEKSRLNFYSSGPVAMHFADTATFSTARIYADIEKYDVPLIMQNGEGHNYYDLSAESYYKLSNKSTVWGNAGYQYGKTKNVSFCDVIQYEKVAPFVIGDDIGGNLTSQQYDFGGGWSHTFGLWSMGLQADYTAAIAHRAIDPRVRNVVSDLNIAIGGGRAIGNDYMIGLNLGAKIYHQNTDVTFYNPSSHAITMVYTGLGSTANRFKGADAQSSTHRLTGFNANIQFVPTTLGDRFYVNLSGDMTNAGLILNGYSNLKFGETSTLTLDGRVSRLFTTGKFSFFPMISARYVNRVATENIFGSSAENYEKIGERKNYHHNRFNVALDIPISWKISNYGTILTLDLSADYNNDKEYLVEPYRCLESKFFTGGVSIDATKKFGRQWSVRLQIGYNGRFITSTSALWGAFDLTSSEGKMTLHNYNMSSCNANTEYASFVISRAIKAVVISLSARYSHYDSNFNKGHNNFTTLSLSF